MEGDEPPRNGKRVTSEKWAVVLMMLKLKCITSHMDKLVMQLAKRMANAAANLNVTVYYLYITSFSGNVTMYHFIVATMHQFKEV